MKKSLKSQVASRKVMLATKKVLERQVSGEKVMRVTYGDGDVKEFDSTEWDAFGPGIIKNLGSKGLCKIVPLTDAGYIEPVE